MGYKYYRLVSIIVNAKGGESETIEKMTKEVDGKVVPCDFEEAKRKMWKALNQVGGNPSTHTMECYILGFDGETKAHDFTENAPIEEAPTEE